MLRKASNSYSQHLKPELDNEFRVHQAGKRRDPTCLWTINLLFLTMPWGFGSLAPGPNDSTRVLGASH